MQSKHSFYLSGQTIVGVAAILFGVLFLLDNLDIVDAQLYVRFWPVVLIVFGLARLMQSTHAGGRFFGAVIVLVGAILLFRTLGFTDIGFRELWPLILVLIGGSMILGSTSREKAHRGEGSSSDTHSVVNAFAMLGGIQRSNNSQAFRGGELSAVMGGCEIDLRQASIQDDEAVVSTFAFWGGIKIKVPHTWDVSLQGIPFLGGFEDKTAHPSDPVSRRLVVKGTAIMGGVEVTN